jgi:hypothetical protein
MFVTDLSGESNARNAKFLRGVAEDEPISPSREDISRQIDRLADVVSRKYPGLEFAVARLVKGQRLAIARNFVPIQ